MKKLAAFDAINLAYIAFVSLVVIVGQPPKAWLFLSLHAAALAWIALILFGHDRFGGRFWTFCRYWYVIPFVLCAFREIHYLVPLVHPFDDHHFDRILQSLDLRWFGISDGLFIVHWPPVLVDVLHLCYWFYYVALLIPAGALYRHRDWSGLREFLAVTMTALLTSYLGYFAVPAIGPHHFMHPRPPVLDGWVLGGAMHRIVVAAELAMPDAFPSGHALMSLVVIVMSWRLYRPVFKIVVGPALGCILATVALRYHYVVDVIAAAGLFPVVFLGGTAFHRWWEGDRGPGFAPKNP